MEEESTLEAVTLSVYVLSTDEHSHEAFGKTECVSVFETILKRWKNRSNDVILCNVLQTNFCCYQVDSEMEALCQGD